MATNTQENKEKKPKILILGADEPEDIDKWPSFESLFGKEVKA